MKSKFLLTVPLAATLLVPAYAQQSTNTTNNGGQQPAAASQQSTNANEDQNLSAHQPLQPETHEGFWGHLNPFARKKYVHRQMQPIRDRVNELDELTASNGKMIRMAYSDHGYFTAKVLDETIKIRLTGGRGLSPRRWTRFEATPARWPPSCPTRRGYSIPSTSSSTA